jgi:hypothetical protein
MAGHRVHLARPSRVSSAVPKARTILYSVTSHTDMLWGDGRDCDIDTRLLVARNLQIVNEQIGS